MAYGCWTPNVPDGQTRLTATKQRILAASLRHFTAQQSLARSVLEALGAAGFVVETSTMRQPAYSRGFFDLQPKIFNRGSRGWLFWICHARQYHGDEGFSVTDTTIGAGNLA